MNKILRQDIDEFTVGSEFASKLRGSSILVTGATGLLGSIFVKCLRKADLGITFVLPVRNMAKAREVFEEDTEHLGIIECDLITFLNAYAGPLDYAVHFASPTNGAYMNSHPVETFELAVDSTKALLQLCRRKSVSGAVYVSSLEYYGQNFDDTPIDESFTGYVDRTSLRSSYPLGKQAAEYIVRAYAAEYGVRACTARLTQTFGAGVARDDKRVFAQFARSIISHSDIELHTEGNSSKPYCYTTDCASALLHLLILGEPGEAYNVANPDTYISIKGLADFLKDNFAPDISVVRKTSADSCYAPETRLNLSVDRLYRLGWRPRYGLKQMFGRLIESMQ